MTPEQARAELLAALVESGALTSEWRPAFDAVARHEFVPDTIWRVDPTAGARLRPLHRGTDPDLWDLWLELAYRDAPVDIQVDDGQPVADGFGWEVTSSASQPSVVAQMLAELDAQPGQRILEIGTGTGWNAALVAHRVGAENVTSIEIDRSVALRARERLDAAGCDKVRLVVGDGADGCPDGAPYDGVIATVGSGTCPTGGSSRPRPVGGSSRR